MLVKQVLDFQVLSAFLFMTEKVGPGSSSQTLSCSLGINQEGDFIRHDISQSCKIKSGMEGRGMIAETETVSHALRQEVLLPL